MKNNQPVTNHEYVLREGAAIISRTDSKGRIVDCNLEFIEASGFTREELIGQPHNMVRHPDMPEEAFRDFWDTLKRGRPWSGMVKNRRKNGDYYWVRATATPLADGSGYSSVRTKPGRDDIDAAEALYRRMRSGENIRLYEGRVVANGLSSRLSRLADTLTISARLWLMAGLIMLLLLASAAIGALVMHRLNDAAHAMGDGKELVADILPPPLYITQANIVARQLLDAGSADIQAQSTLLENLKQQYEDRYRYWMGSSLPQSLKDNLSGEQHRQAVEWWHLALERYLPAIRAGDRESAASILGLMDRHFLAHEQGITATVKEANALNDEKTAAFTNERKRSIWVMSAIAAAGVLITLLSVAWIVRHIRHRFLVADSVVSAISGGDLTQRIPPVGQDEIGRLVVKMAIMRNSLHELIAAIRQNVEALTRASQSLTQNAQTGADASGAQSSAASSMAAAVEELSVSVDMVESNAGDAHAITQDSARRSTEGGQIIHEAASEMERIASAVHTTAGSIKELEDYSQQISSIIDVIRDIADQTNLLALNAAIEAARAGEHGRGFAVVSDEVRKLAERTNSSTQEIAEMIAKIQGGTERAAAEMVAGVERVKEGVRLAREAGNSIAVIREGSDKVTRAVQEISHALKEQGTATRDIAQKVEEIAQAADANSSSSAATALSAQSLHRLSEELQVLTTRFRIT
jgi:PAS domain S-box-containing protein